MGTLRNDRYAGALIVANHGGELRLYVGGRRVVERFEHQVPMPHDFVNDGLTAFSDFRS